MVGTKADLTPQRQVTVDNVEEFMLSQQRIDAYVEPSAKIGINIGALFNTVIQLVLNRIVDDTNDVNDIFSNIDYKGSQLITNNNLFKRTDYKDRGMNSSELNAIIKKAKVQYVINRTDIRFLT